MDTAERDTAGECWEALRDAAAAQAKHQAPSGNRAHGADSWHLAALVADIWPGTSRSAQRWRAGSVAWVLRLAARQLWQMGAARRLHRMGGWR